MSTRDVVRKAKPKIYPVETPDGVVYVRALSSVGRQRYMDIAQEAGEGRFPAARIAALALCDEDGTPAYDPDNPLDVAEVGEMDAVAVDAVCLKLVDASGMTAKANEEAEKK